MVKIAADYRRNSKARYNTGSDIKAFILFLRKVETGIKTCYINLAVKIDNLFKAGSKAINVVVVYIFN